MKLVWWNSEQPNHRVLLLSNFYEDQDKIVGFVENGGWDFEYVKELKEILSRNVYSDYVVTKLAVDELYVGTIPKEVYSSGDYNDIIYKALDFIKEANEKI